jgi:hypothetical protein
MSVLNTLSIGGPPVSSKDQDFCLKSSKQKTIHATICEEVKNHRINRFCEAHYGTICKNKGRCTLNVSEYIVTLFTSCDPEIGFGSDCGARVGCRCYVEGLIQLKVV